MAELKRRNVYRAAVGYAAIAWLVTQVVTQISPYFDIPSGTVRVIVVLLIAGFPCALVLAWVFELTPAGVKRTEDVAPGESIARSTGRKIDFVIITALLLAVAILVLRSRPTPPRRGSGEREEHRGVAV